VHVDLMKAGMRTRIAARSHSALTPQQVRVVGLMALNGPMRSSQLASALGVSRSTMTGLLDRLEQAGWVIRGTDPADGRSRPAEVTEAGRRALSEMLSALHPSPEQIVERLTIRELECLVTGFQAILRAKRSLEMSDQVVGEVCGWGCAESD
jgi:DNA-binding MarR family transcriptional regulator